jgi:hypothetical protein
LKHCIRWLRTIALLAKCGAALAAGSPDAPVPPAPNALPTPSLAAPTGHPTGPMSVDLGPDLQGPYNVKQVQTLGRERIKGEVCALADEFDVIFETPPASFKMHFKPDIVAARSPNAVPLHGTLTYQYSIPRAGETHDATGLYDLAADSAAHRIHVVIEVKDHVRFKGFDGVPRTRYRFDLEPDPAAPCP